MPVHINSIGTAVFFDLIGTVLHVQEQLEVIERPGVDGSGARRIGKRGKPFPLVSIAYYDSFEDFKDTFDEYLLLVGVDPVELIRNSVSYGNYLILEVAEATPPQAVFNVAGSPGSECRAECRWTLLG